MIEEAFAALKAIDTGAQVTHANLNQWGRAFVTIGWAIRTNGGGFTLTPAGHEAYQDMARELPVFGLMVGGHAWA
jgi:hypothetical protein